MSHRCRTLFRAAEGPSRMSNNRIAGFGFSTIGRKPDLTDLDRSLGEIEEVGASHCELALFGAQLVAGGRVLPEMRRRLERSPVRLCLKELWGRYAFTMRRTGLVVEKRFS